MKEQMKLLYLLFLVLAAATVSAAEEPLAFKGLAIGATEEEVVKKYPKLSCRGEPARRSCSQASNEKERSKLLSSCIRGGESPAACRQKVNEELEAETVASVPIRYMLFRFHDNKLGLVSLVTPAAEFSKVASAYLDRYGKPAKDEAWAFKPKGGTTIQNREFRWLFPAGTIRVTRWSAQVNDSSVLYLSHEGARAFTEQYSEDRKKAASDL
jgi:hypothetical protein